LAAFYPSRAKKPLFQIESEYFSPFFKTKDDLYFYFVSASSDFGLVSSVGAALAAGAGAPPGVPGRGPILPLGFMRISLGAVGTVFAAGA